MTGPMGRKVLKFDSPSGAEGCGIALAGDEYEVSVTGFSFPPHTVILSLRNGTVLYCCMAMLYAEQMSRKYKNKKNKKQSTYDSQCFVLYCLSVL